MPKHGFSQTIKDWGCGLGTKRSLATQAIWALLLTFGFYLLVLVILLILFVGPLVLIYSIPIFGAIALIPMWSIGVIILRAMVPPDPEKHLPGVEVTRVTQPELYACIDKVAAEADLTSPHKVYFCLAPVAGIRARGGFFGFGGEYLLHIGLPLMSTLTVSQFRAAVAHELGHCSGSDMPLSRWVFGARNRALETAMQLEARGSWVSGFFTDFLDFYLAATQSISRHQEREADRIAANTIGAEPLVSLLRKSIAIEAGWSTFWGAELVPALKHSLFVPITEGFAQFYCKAKNNGNFDRFIEKSMSAEQSHPHDSHPVTRDRIERIRATRPAEASLTLDDRNASTLLQDISELEREAVAWATGQESVMSFTLVDIDHTMELVQIPEYHDLVEMWPKLLENLSPATLPVGAETFERLATTVLRPKEYDTSTIEMLNIALQTIAAALTLRVMREGWQPNRVLGEPVSVTYNSYTFSPILVVQRLIHEPEYESEWLKQCSEFGIGELLFSDLFGRTK